MSQRLDRTFLAGDESILITVANAFHFTSSNDSTLSSMDFEGAVGLDISDTGCTNVNMTLQSTVTWRFENIIFFQTSPALNCSLSFVGPTSGQAIDLGYFTPFGTPTIFDRALKFSGQVNFDSSSRLLSNRLLLSDGAQVEIPFLEITGSIDCDSGMCLSPTTIRPPPSGASEYSFPPIPINNVTLDLENLVTLTYDVRINGRLSMANNGEIKMGPSTKIHIAWDPNIIGTSPPNNVQYTLATIDPLQATPWNIETMTPADDRYEFELKWAEFPRMVYQIKNPLTCPMPYPTGFTCANGVFVAIGSVDIPVITIPGGSGTVTVIGNLTVNGTITFQGLGSSVSVSGCANVETIEIILGEDEPIPTDPVLILTQGSGCIQSLADSQINLNAKGRGCKKVKVSVDQSTSNNNQLVAIFSIDTKDCNVKWIILGSVLGAVLIAVIVLILIFTLNKKARNCIRPYSAKASA